MTRTLLVLAALVLAGCSSQRPAEPVHIPYEVKVPVYVKEPAPGELQRRYVPTELPKFISPDDKSAIVGLSQQDLDRLKVILRTLTTRDDAWRQWAAQPAKEPGK